ncbi:hypothetical protein D3C72_1058520 [compost metagenome]
MAAAQGQDRDGHRREGAERAGVGERRDLAEGQEGRDQADDDGRDEGHGDGRAGLLAHAAEAQGQHAVAGHREEDAGLAEHEGQDHRGQGHDHDDGQQRAGPAGADAREDVGERVGGLHELLVGRGADGGGDDGHVDDSAGDHRADDADGQVARGLVGLLGRGGHGVEAVKGEEHDRRRGHHADGLAVLDRREEPVGHEGLEVGHVEVRQSQRDEQAQGRNFEHDQHQIDVRALAGAAQQHAGHQRDDYHRRQVHPAAGAGPGQQHARHMGRLEKALHVAGPADGHGRADHAVLEDQAPAHHPGDALAQSREAVGVSAARRGDGRGQLGVAQRRAGADDARDHEGQHHRRPRDARAHPHERVDARADDRPDAQGNQMRPGEGPPQGIGAVFGHQLIDRFASSEQARFTSS